MTVAPCSGLWIIRLPPGLLALGVHWAGGRDHGYRSGAHLKPLGTKPWSAYGSEGREAAHPTALGNNQGTGRVW
jgi:hypothetical protein